jgi:hypothetical protein
MSEIESSDELLHSDPLAVHQNIRNGKKTTDQKPSQVSIFDKRGY